MDIRLKGEYKDTTENVEYNIISIENDTELVFALVQNNKVVSAYKKEADRSSSYRTNEAKKVYEVLAKGLRYCTAKNKVATPFALGIANTHVIDNKGGFAYSISKFANKVCGCEISSEDRYLFLQYDTDVQLPDNIPWVILTENNKKKKVDLEEFASSNFEEDIPVRSLSEISLDKDITWLKNKKYYVVNNDEVFDKLLKQEFDEYKGSIAYDTETTGLRINMFGKVGSQKKRELEEYNEKARQEGKNTIRVDKLVGIIFCKKPNESFYFPVGNRRFRNLFELVDGKYTPTAQKIVDNILVDYTIGKYKDRDDDMASYIRNTPKEQWGSDVILMERCRPILEHGNLAAHNGIFEWKVSWLYNIDINLVDDTIILHKLLYKFRSTKSNSGEKSDLKFLTGKEFNVEQLDLKDFFLEYSEDTGEKVQEKTTKSKSKKKSRYIDFSYMDLNGSRAYAPADGDFTLQLLLKYKRDLKENHADMEYIYSVEIIVSCAIAYMEFYGHRIDEEQIETAKINSSSYQVNIENQFRKLVKYDSEKENLKVAEMQRLEEYVKKLEEGIKGLSARTQADQVEKIRAQIKELNSRRMKCVEEYREIVDNSDKNINLNSAKQMSEFFYKVLKIPPAKGEHGEEITSVGKKVLKQYVTAKNEHGEDKYPEVILYTKWKNEATLLSKFFDNLPEFMYPGGYIFSSYGQISTATGRMSCNKPNARATRSYMKSIWA